MHEVSRHFLLPKVINSIFTVGEAVRATCGNSHDDEDMTGKDPILENKVTNLIKVDCEHMPTERHS